MHLVAGCVFERADLGGLAPATGYAQREDGGIPSRIPCRWIAVAVAVVVLTGHLGGFLSGVNGQGR